MGDRGRRQAGDATLLYRRDVSTVILSSVLRHVKDLLHVDFRGAPYYMTITIVYGSDSFHCVCVVVDSLCVCVHIRLYATDSHGYTLLPFGDVCVLPWMVYTALTPTTYSPTLHTHIYVSGVSPTTTRIPSYCLVGWDFPSPSPTHMPFLHTHTHNSHGSHCHTTHHHTHTFPPHLPLFPHTTQEKDNKKT